MIDKSVVKDSAAAAERDYLMKMLSTVLPYSLGLYGIAVLTTMAGMEITGWLSFLVMTLILVFDRSRDHDSTRIDTVRSILEKSDWAFLSLMLIIIMSAVIAAPKGSDTVFIVGNARFVPLFIVLRLALERIGVEAIEKYFRFLIILVGLVSLYTIFQHLTGIDFIRGDRDPVSRYYFDGGFTYRGRGMWGHPVTFGHSMALSFCMVAGYAAVSFLRPGSDRWNWIAAIVTVLSGLSLLWSYTRGAWIGTAAAALVMTFYLGRKVAVSAVALGLTGIAIASAASVQFRERLFSVVSLTDTSNTQRLDVWRANIAMFFDHPILGVGYGMNEELITEYYRKLGIQQEFGGHAHSNFLQFLSGTGLLGFGAFIFVTALLLSMSHRLLRILPPSETWLRAVALGALGAQVALHVGGLTECNFKDAEVNHQYMLILAILTAVWRKRPIARPES